MSGRSAQTTIAECGIRFELAEVVEFDAKTVESGSCRFDHAKIGQRIEEQTAN
jgi:hypothetical protein